MKKIVYFFVALIIVLPSCKSTEKLLREGRYDEAVNIAVKKLQRNPGNEKQAHILDVAYPRAVEKDLQRIKFLKQEGQPGNWDEIYNIYLRLKRRQELVETVTPVNAGGKTVQFSHVDYDAQLIEAKNRAAEYHYAMGKRLMKQGNRYAYRKAYEEFKKAKFYNPAYLDVDNLMAQCLANGTTYVLLKPVNKTIYRLPQDYLQNLVNFPLDKLSSQWIIYDNQDTRNGDYDLIIYVVLKAANITADKEVEKNYTETKKIQTGYFIKRDANGNVMLDSNGNPIKIPKYSNVSCQVREFQQIKIATIIGELQYYDTRTGQIVNTVPISAEHRFFNAYATAAGNMKACSDRTRELLDNRPVPFPRNMDMILAAGETLKDVIWQALYDNRYYLINKY